MQVGLPPKFAKTIKFEGSKETMLPKIESVMTELKLGPKRTENGLSGGTQMGMMSWGEAISVEFVSENEVKIQSMGKFIFPIFDYGMNEKNVNKIVEKLGL